MARNERRKPTPSLKEYAPPWVSLAGDNGRKTSEEDERKVVYVLLLNGRTVREASEHQNRSVFIRSSSIKTFVH